MGPRINWSVQDAAELHASVLIAAAAACAGSAKDTELFLRNVAMALTRHAEFTSPNVRAALLGVSEMLRASAPPAPMYQEDMRLRRLAS